MNDDDKKKCLDYLEGSPLFQSALKAFKDDKEKEKAKTLAQDVFLKMFEGMLVMKKVSEEHSDKVSEVAKKRIDKI